VLPDHSCKGTAVTAFGPMTDRQFSGNPTKSYPANARSRRVQLIQVVLR
jgi:hypothetical protein